jgi:hypothetical protein
LSDVREWYGERLYERPETDSGIGQLRFMWNSSHLKGALNPIESIERFITYNEMREGLDELREEGKEIMDIYYAEEMSLGEEEWSVDVYQDELNERCRLNWTWTVMNKKQLERDSEKEDELPEWMVIDAKGDKRKVFYYDGFYGSVVVDVESDRLLGKIEGIDEDIVYEGRTVRECEQRFREAVSRYKKK